MTRRRVVLAVVAAIALAGCSTDRGGRVAVGSPDELLERIHQEPPPEGSPEHLVGGIAARIEREYALVDVWDVALTGDGQRVAYAVRMRLDPRAEHPAFEDWQAHVTRAARDQREAAVVMLKATVAAMDGVRFVSVWQDEFLQPYWNRRQILRMEEPSRYRRFERYQALVLSAAILPGRPAG